MVATSGDQLVPDDTVDAIRDHLLPLSTVITPNLPEAAVLAGIDEPSDRESMIAAAESLRELGARGARSEERRVGKEGRARSPPQKEKTKEHNRRQEVHNTSE